MANRYAPYTWVNGDSRANAANLNHMEQGIEALDAAVDGIEQQIANGTIGGSGGDADTLGGHVPQDYLLTDILSDDIDLNTVTKFGLYKCQDTHLNIPQGEDQGFLLVCQSGTSTEFTQIYFSVIKNIAYMRTGYIGNNIFIPITTWSVLGNGCDADKLDGYHASSFSFSGHSHDYIPSRKITVSATAPTAPFVGDLWIW